MEWVDVRYVIATVYINRLQESGTDPGPQHDHVVREEQDANKETHSEYWKQNGTNSLILKIINLHGYRMIKQILLEKLNLPPEKY